MCATISVIGLFGLGFTAELGHWGADDGVTRYAVLGPGKRRVHLASILAVTLWLEIQLKCRAADTLYFRVCSGGAQAICLLYRLKSYATFGLGE